MPDPVTPTPGAEPVAPPATPTEPQAPPASPEPSGDPGTPTPPATPVAPTPPVPSEPSGAEKRIAQLVAKVHDAEREAAYLRGLVESRGTVQPPPPPPTDPGPPKQDQFEQYEDFVVAKTRYELTKEFRAEAVRTREADARKTREDAEREAERQFQARMDAAAEKDPEITTIFRDRTLPISDAMIPAIKESEVAPQLLRYLHEHREEAKRIFRLSPIAAARELGRIETRFLQPPTTPPDPPRRVSQAPAPITPVSPAGSVAVNEADLPMDEFVKRRNAAEFGPRR